MASRHRAALVDDPEPDNREPLVVLEPGGCFGEHSVADERGVVVEEADEFVAGGVESCVAAPGDTEVGRRSYDAVRGVDIGVTAVHHQHDLDLDASLPTGGLDGTGKRFFSVAHREDDNGDGCHRRMLPATRSRIGFCIVLRVSIVVRALNEAADLPALYAGLAAQTRQPDEVILVDSGSTDDTVAISQEAGAAIVHIAPGDFSFGGALNLGCTAASGDVLVFVSAHVYPIDEFWLERLVAPFADDDVALVYGRQTGDEERTAFSEMEILRRWFPDRSNDDQDHPFCNNANCAVRASVWKTIPYDERLTGLEDMDWASRALADGHRLVYAADATIAHIHEETFSQTVNRYRREAIAHKRIFGHQKMRSFEALGLFLANTVRDYAAAIPRRKLLRNLVAIPRFRAAQFWGTWKGFRQDGDPTLALKRHFYYPKGLTPKAERYAKPESRPR